MMPAILARRVAGLLLCALALSACSTQTWYESARVGAENECRNRPATAAEECLARLNKQKYEDYERARSGQ